MPKHTLQDGEGIIIEIPSAARDRDGRSTPVKPGAKPGDPTELQGRRRARPSGIQFYDCGQILSGESYIDVPFSRSGTLTGYPGDKPNYVFTSTDFDALEDYLFTTPLDQWSSKYKRLDFENGYKLAIDLDFKNPGSSIRSAAKTDQRYNVLEELTSGVGWSSAGMKRLPHNSFEFHGFLAFNSFPAGAGYKVTASRNYGASNIPGWTIPSKCQIFVLPRILNIGIYYEEIVDFVDRDYWFALAPYSAVSRILFQNRITSIQSVPSRPWLNYFPFIAFAETLSTNDLEFFLDTYLVSSARTYKAETRDSVTTWAEIPHSSFPRSSLESNPADGVLYMTSGLEVNTVPLESSIEPLPGTLLAVVTSGSSEYYVWKD